MWEDFITVKCFQNNFTRFLFLVWTEIYTYRIICDDFWVPCGVDDDYLRSLRKWWWRSSSCLNSACLIIYHIIWIWLDEVPMTLWHSLQAKPKRHKLIKTFISSTSCIVSPSQTTFNSFFFKLKFAVQLKKNEWNIFMTFCGCYFACRFFYKFGEIYDLLDVHMVCHVVNYCLISKTPHSRNAFTTRIIC